ncbi:MAG TPA: amidohydrolase family protein [Chloroflexota bacterium]|nr:amidohydrolase family protein [Chloroflexota bacterium]
MIIIDADGHIIDDETMYRQRMPEQYRQHRGGFYPSDGFDRGQNNTKNWRPNSVEKNLADNDLEGIDLQVYYPTGGLGLSWVREVGYATALARTYNDWVHEWCQTSPKRLKAVAIVPLQADVRAAIEEMTRAVGQLGAVGVMVHAFDHARNVGHRDFWPFYEECARQGVAVGFHGHGSTEMNGTAHFDNFLGVHTWSHAPDQLVACTAVMYSGILEKFQDLRVAFLEAGCGWAPFWMEHMDEEWEKRKFDAPLLTAPPSEYMTNGRVWVACEPEEKTIPYVSQWIGEDHILYASDYPHWDGGFPHSVETLAGRTDISEGFKQKIFFDNPQAFYGFKVNPADYGPTGTGPTRTASGEAIA